jgi:hypothetical protein
VPTERGASVARLPSKLFRCHVVSETVTIALRRRTSFGEDNGTLFVQCNERDCQYVDTNAPPCPLTLELFSTEIAARAAPRAE